MAKRYWIWVELESLSGRMLMTQIEEGTSVKTFLNDLLLNVANRMYGVAAYYDFILPDGSYADLDMVLTEEILSGKPRFRVVSRTRTTNALSTRLYGCPLASEIVGVIPECMIEHPAKGKEQVY